MAARKLKTAVAAAPTARDLLADAIERSRATESEIANIRAAIEKAEGVCRAARTRAFAAEAAIEQAGKAAADHAVAVALGERRKAPMSVKAARATAAAAAEAVETTAATVVALRAKLVDAEGMAWLPRKSVEDAAAAVLRDAPEVESLVSKVADLQAKLANAAGALCFLHHIKGIDVDRVTVDNVREFSRAENVVFRLQSPVMSWTALLRDSELFASWRAAIDNLKIDASAALPA